ncbi:MAG: hypothetical protein U0457_08060 [Candidatus Sericytochromatia bacterium]
MSDLSLKKIPCDNYNSENLIKNQDSSIINKNIIKENLNSPINDNKDEFTIKKDEFTCNILLLSKTLSKPIKFIDEDYTKFIGKLNN